MVGTWSRRAMLASSAAAAACASRGVEAPVIAAAPPPITIERTATVTVPEVGETTAEFGKVTVAAVRGDPTSGTFDLAFVRLRSPSANGLAPIVWLEGGPGVSCTWMAEDDYGREMLAPLLAATDVILLDQRGTGRSQPAATFRSTRPIEPDYFVSREIGLRRDIEITREAVAHFQTQGLRLDSLTNEENAHDVDDLRRALGLERVSLYGFSYGTHLALTVLRRHGANIERAILLGTEGPDHNLKLPLSVDRAFDRIATLAAADPNVAGAGDLWALLHRVCDRLDREPLTVTIPIDNTPTPVRLGSWGLKLILRIDIGDASDIPVFPRLLHSIDQDDLGPITWFARRRFGGRGANAMNMMIDSTDRWTARRQVQVEVEARQSYFGQAANVFYPEIADAWPTPTLDPDHLEPVRSAVPTLFISGEYDWNTPPAQAEEVARGFRNATLITVGNAGHEQTYTHPDVRAAMTRYLRGEDVSGLAPAHPPIRFVPLRDGVAGAPTHPSLQRA